MLVDWSGSSKREEATVAAMSGGRSSRRCALGGDLSLEAACGANRLSSPRTSRCCGITTTGRRQQCVYAAAVVGGLQKMGEAAGFASNGGRHRPSRASGRLLSTLHLPPKGDRETVGG